MMMMLKAMDECWDGCNERASEPKMNEPLVSPSVERNSGCCKVSVQGASRQCQPRSQLSYCILIPVTGVILHC